MVKEEQPLDKYYNSKKSKKLYLKQKFDIYKFGKSKIIIVNLYIYVRENDPLSRNIPYFFV